MHTSQITTKIIVGKFDPTIVSKPMVAKMKKAKKDMYVLKTLQSE